MTLSVMSCSEQVITEYLHMTDSMISSINSIIAAVSVVHVALRHHGHDQDQTVDQHMQSCTICNL